jgi:hypothetical protein
MLDGRLLLIVEPLEQNPSINGRPTRRRRLRGWRETWEIVEEGGH